MLPLDYIERIKSLIPSVKDFPIDGVSFKDISPLLMEPHDMNVIVSKLALLLEVNSAEVIIGVESRGFLVAGIMASIFDYPISLVRKKGKLPPPVISYEYQKEYGTDTLEIKQSNGWVRAIIVDDILATGGTLQASYELCTLAGYDVRGIGVLADLEYLHEPDYKVGGIPVQSVLQFQE